MKFIFNLVKTIVVIVLTQIFTNSMTTSLMTNSRKYVWNRRPIQSKGRIFWDQLSSSGLVPVEINVQDTVTDLATGLGQMWSNAQEWWQEIQANAQRPRPDTEGINPVTDKLPIPNIIKKKKPSGSLKANVIDNKVQIMSDEPEVQKVKKKKKKLKKKRIKKIIDYKNYMYFFMGLLGVWPTF